MDLQEIIYDAAETDEIRGGTFRFSGLPCFSVNRCLRWRKTAYRMATFRVHALNGAVAGQIADRCKWRIENERGVHGT